MQEHPNVLLSTAYLAPISYYCQLYAAPLTCMEQHDHYLKQTYRNRCLIATSGGVMPLTIPTESNNGNKCLVRDVRISDHGNWRHTHWNALESAYRQTPFFEYYADDFRPFFQKRYDFLLDFNEELRQMVCSLIAFNPRVELTTEYIHPSPEGFIDLREAIHPKRNSLPSALFHVTPYYQVFSDRHGFLPDLSIVDLLFNMGPESLLVLRDSSTMA